MWPEAVRAVRQVRPQAFLFENVRGLLRSKFSPYLESIVAGLANPDRDRRLSYNVQVQQVDAADFGAPQRRHRVLITGFRTDLSVRPAPLRKTHSRERLLWDKFVTGEYWTDHGLPVAIDAFSKSEAATVARLRHLKEPPSGERWVTVRDALKGLGEPTGQRNHVFQAGARVYKGHTGCDLDQPAKALKAGDHGVPGGENMMITDEGPVRYFTLREAARLQGLPDEFGFPRSWTESMRQLGNAVPVQLAEAAGGMIIKTLTDLGGVARQAA
jgi:DNA (cytosine-5)-methyltransferase 1